jgi:uridine kinase
MLYRRTFYRSVDQGSKECGNSDIPESLDAELLREHLPILQGKRILDPSFYR